MCSRHAKLGAFLVTLGVIVPALRGQAAPAEVHPRPPHVIRMCILPFYTSTSRASLDGDLAPLLEAGLSRYRWLELIPAKTVYEWTHSLEPRPWLVKGLWEEGGETRDAEVFFWLRKRLLQKARARFPADYHAIGRVVSTGRRKSLVIEITEPGPGQGAVFTSSQSAETIEEVPEAVNRAAAEIVRFLKPRWAEGTVEEVRREYLGRVRSLARSVRECEAQVEAYPESPVLRLYLLSLYEEDSETYETPAKETAEEIVRLWGGREEDARRAAERLGVDPFLVLCREQAKEGDWAGVETTARLGLESRPLRSAVYEEWRSRAREALAEEKKSPR